jgi:hypothetical protein
VEAIAMETIILVVIVAYLAWRFREVLHKASR